MIERARKPFNMLLSTAERRELDRALRAENAARDVEIGLGTKLRLLGLAWARGAGTGDVKKKGRSQ